MEKTNSSASDILNDEVLDAGMVMTEGMRTFELCVVFNFFLETVTRLEECSQEWDLFDYGKAHFGEMLPYTTICLK